MLQFVENLTDRQAAHAVRARIDVKYLLGLELTDPGFDFTVLTGFRQRLLDHGLEERVLDLLLERLAGQGLVSAGGRQRTDSTHVLAAVRRLNRLEFVGETHVPCPAVRAEHGAGRPEDPLVHLGPGGQDLEQSGPPHVGVRFVREQHLYAVSAPYAVAVTGQPSADCLPQHGVEVVDDSC
ncbi:transposase [Streptomyces sp. NPDC006333]|uniref:transposase n=1 Tax=Streptomyces sp. NPDC006333 TaxID=3156753 RepID=UPI0033A9014F